jgi:hypothetical protein
MRLGEIAMGKSGRDNRWKDRRHDFRLAPIGNKRFQRQHKTAIKFMDSDEAKERQIDLDLDEDLQTGT